ncbi:DUF3761 domain-containing protein [Glaciimonas sp. CA11.2]|uniref:DUF3761 domain-containing protein n=1 Tax=unclassified Glaciimonas TaxID=2644401 RepID=UPI002AB574D0|nr:MULTISPECIES: DUF3761 domain-containing protein [unclassified Glaciimonas]MDY7546163.1 DUF3761 domain-containing protein [Glaciimonas sp. CA11.2]MEB0010887.1 DUF3761 domain-containing protein [Glaciimonas sp. Cout2]MEB0081668.1 DUF3761 domain-containing protein [Glaciimonas sp. Gout2]MEB0161585.1 DUF3761 domain-containing protein [Glaciimonas sp. CA11.2]
MKTLLLSASLALALLTSAGSYAQAPAGAPAGSTGLCKDGTYYSGATKSGACSGHKGVKDWYATKATTPAATPAATPAPASKPMAAPSAASTASSAVAPGGGPGLVWANTSTKVYHCQNTKYYGKTKAGAYMSEADAKTKGYHADHGKACG